MLFCVKSQLVVLHYGKVKMKVRENGIVKIILGTKRYEETGNGEK